MSNLNEPKPENAPVIVGVGASAGGLEAFQQLIKGLPEAHNLVIILVQHLDPNHESLMPELIRSKTSSPVHSAEDKMKVQPGHIYLIPPGFQMEISGMELSLFEFTSPRGVRRPIDHFFESLAIAHGESAIAVVLSGTGSDGAKGAREVKGAGGLVFVQDPKQAKYDGMPQSVLDNVGADVVTKAEEIIDVIRDYFNLRSGMGPEMDSDDQFLHRVMRHVRFRTGHDFVDYKNGTMLRRIAVRMSVLNLNEPSDYLKHLAENKEEANKLFRDLLINVTSFFRDKNHFENLRTLVIPEIIKRASQNGEVRVWIAGCSTGEEAYSVGILLAEEVERVDKQCTIVVFGTDIDEQALATARMGRYPEAAVEAVPEPFVERYFKPTQDGYEVGSVLREMVRFSRHSFIKDPPFSKIDLLCCRNVLIYLKDNLQDLSCKVFHYALREDGYLFIGPSENPKSIGTYFEEVSSRDRIYTRRPGPSKSLNLASLSRGTFSGGAKEPKEADVQEQRLSDVERIAFDNYMPAFLHVDPENRVIFASENAAKYLAVRSGRVSTDLFSFIAPELETIVRRVARVEKKTGSTVSRQFQDKVNGEVVRIAMTARRLADGGILLVFKDELELLEQDRQAKVDGGEAQNSYIQQLEVELDEAKRDVRTTIEELETSNEELKSSNEEMMSMNEELQSANEELTTINDELQEKVREINQANVDLKNYVDSARVATVFLNRDLQLLNFTPEAEEYFSFEANDIGRPLESFSSDIDLEAVLKLCRLTVTDKSEREEKFIAKNGLSSYSVRIMPYLVDGKTEPGVVFTVLDITELREAVLRAEEALQIAEQHSQEVEQIYKTSPMAMGLIDRDMKYVRLNEELANINGEDLELHLGRSVRQIIPTVADHTEALIQKVLDTEKPIYGERVRGSTRTHPEDERVWDSDWVPFYTDNELTGVSVTVRDVTDQANTADNLRRIMRELEHRVKNMLSNVTSLINRAKRDASSDAEVFDTLIRRIDGLANTHSLLTAEQWSSASLVDIIKPETIDIYGDERVTISGPNIRVSSEATLALGMAIHELATNATKYGAFSVADGCVRIKWSRVNNAEGDFLIIEWIEENGPEVSAPDDLGFGSQLISSTIEHSLGGKIEKKWEPTGLSVVIWLEFSEVTVT